MRRTIRVVSLILQWLLTIRDDLWNNQTVLRLVECDTSVTSTDHDLALQEEADVVTKIGDQMDRMLVEEHDCNIPSVLYPYVSRHKSARRSSSAIMPSKSAERHRRGADSSDSE
jgi:hypothetical protein